MEGDSSPSDTLISNLTGALKVRTSTWDGAWKINGSRRKHMDDVLSPTVSVWQHFTVIVVSVTCVTVIEPAYDQSPYSYYLSWFGFN